MSDLGIPLDSEPDLGIPLRSYDLIDDLVASHPADEVCRLLMNPRLTAEQRLFAATRAAAKRELITELANLKAAELAPTEG